MMTYNNSIKIRNIYYMLSYAFSVLRENGYEKLANEDFENAADLLSAILAKGIAIQIKRGLGRAYIPHTEPLSIMRGKIDIAASIKEQTMRKKQLVCSYDEFSVNTTCNQIIKTTACFLLRQDIKPQVKKELKNLLLYFKDIDTVNPYLIDWNMRFHRNNKNEQLLISICYLVCNSLLQKDEHGNIKMQKFLDEQRLCTLYEKFILEYYKTHFPQLKAAARTIAWDIEPENPFISLLPQMRSDIMLRTADGRILIIDAKFYTRSMATSYHNEKKTFHSNNLYQIFTYVKNQEVNNRSNVSGMLLYAKTDEEVTPDALYQMSGNQIMVKNLDLNQNFKEIRTVLDAFAINFEKNLF